jgi:hypothetical protein
MNGKYEEVARVFIEQYNLTKGTHYRFECLRTSIFSSPMLQYPALKIYQMVFTEGEKEEDAFVVDLTVMLDRKNRLLIDVIEPHLPKEGAKVSVERCIVQIVEPVERDSVVFGEPVSSKHLLIDGRGFGCIGTLDPAFYKEFRLLKDSLLEQHERLNKMLGIRKEDDNVYEELSRSGISTEHWFKEIWFLYRDEKSVVTCIQIW